MDKWVTLVKVDLTLKTKSTLVRVGYPQKSAPDLEKWVTVAKVGYTRKIGLHLVQWVELVCHT